MTEPISKRLTRLMEEKSLTIRKAAELSGTAPSNISNWLSGSSPTDFQALKRLADALDVTVGYILLGYDENKAVREMTIDDMYCKEEIFDGLVEIKIKRLTKK